MRSRGIVEPDQLPPVHAFLEDRKVTPDNPWIEWTLGGAKVRDHVWAEFELGCRRRRGLGGLARRES